jgi:hypothetical protein
MDKADPKRAKLLSDSDAPRWVLPRTDRAAPKRANPNSEIDTSNWEILREINGLLIFVPSRASTKRSGRPILSTRRAEPIRPKLLRDNVAPTLE